MTDADSSVVEDRGQGVREGAVLAALERGRIGSLETRGVVSDDASGCRLDPTSRGRWKAAELQFRNAAIGARS
jgi:hypothetical protein